MKRVGIVLLLGVVLAVTLGARQASQRIQDDVDERIQDDVDEDEGLLLTAKLRGGEEPPAISTLGSGSFLARLSDDGLSLEYELRYSDLQGSVLQSHIHLGQRGVNGGIAAFLCSNLGNGPAGTPACPGPNAGTVTGMIMAAQVIGPGGQGLAAGEFEEFLRAIDKDLTYVNVHSSIWPGGEIRGQIDLHDGDDDDDN